jgi:hypothetical protein
MGPRIAMARYLIEGGQSGATVPWLAPTHWRGTSSGPALGRPSALQKISGSFSFGFVACAAVAVRTNGSEVGPNQGFHKRCTITTPATGAVLLVALTSANNKRPLTIADATWPNNAAAKTELIRDLTRRPCRLAHSKLHRQARARATNVLSGEGK